MPIESKRELIVQNLENALGEIDGLDPYWTNVTSVSRMPEVPSMLPVEDKPGIVICTSGFPETLQHIDSHHDRREMILIIAGIADKTSNGTAREINRFMQDASVAIQKDPTRGNIANSTSIIRRLETTQAESSVSRFEILVRIAYECDHRIE